MTLQGSWIREIARSRESTSYYELLAAKPPITYDYIERSNGLKPQWWLLKMLKYIYTVIDRWFVILPV